ncbi:MAG: sn-glycerol-3-phosphate ABC transporter ATP-binding protein UgpC [Bacillota bacterium]|nr:sn-glycerol-3-phosphate ABC transporter ATP-binding protein UgpC [Bacillota bacterium]
MADVKLVNVFKKFGDVTAVNDVSLEIKDHEFIVLVGPSGCGKSTTLRMVAGLEDITQGEIYIGERFVNEVAPKDRDIAMVFQNYALYPHMNVFENMAFGLKLRKMAKSDIAQKVKEAAAILGLEQLLHRKPKELSGGQKQRVALGRAMVREPAVFLMDEPLSNLDAKLRVQMRLEIIKLHQRVNTTTIYVTHDQVEAMTMGDRMVVMNNGLVQQVGTPDGIYNHPANIFVAGFIGSPAMNFLRGTYNVKDGKAFVTDERGNYNIPLPNEVEHPVTAEQVILGIRPNDIILLEEGQDSPQALNAVVDVVEAMGSEIYCYMKVGSQNITARFSPEHKLAIGQHVRIALRPHKMHLFDNESEQAYF